MIIIMCQILCNYYCSTSRYLRFKYKRIQTPDIKIPIIIIINIIQLPIYQYGNKYLYTKTSDLHLSICDGK